MPKRPTVRTPAKKNETEENQEAAVSDSIRRASADLRRIWEKFGSRTLHALWGSLSRISSSSSNPSAFEWRVKILAWTAICCRLCFRARECPIPGK
jgi:hypothetical protein